MPYTPPTLGAAAASVKRHADVKGHFGKDRFNFILVIKRSSELCPCWCTLYDIVPYHVRCFKFSGMRAQLTNSTDTVHRAQRYDPAAQHQSSSLAAARNSMRVWLL